MTCMKCDREVEPRTEKYIHAHDKTVVHVKCPVGLLRQMALCHNAITDMQNDLELMGQRWNNEPE